MGAQELARALKAMDSERYGNSLGGTGVEKEKSKWEKTLHFLNRGTAGSASFLDELLYDEDPEKSALSAWLEGVGGHGQVQSFSEILNKAGWKPDSKAGKALRGIVGFGLDVGLDPSTYLSFGAAPLSKATKAAGKVISATSKAGFITKEGKLVRGIAGAKQAVGAAKDLPKDVQKGAKVLFDAIDSKDPILRDIAKKAFAGKPLTRTEETRLGVRSFAAIQGLFGGPAASISFGQSTKIFELSSKVAGDLAARPLINPMVHGIGKAFNRWHDLKAKHPEYFQLRKKLEASAHTVTADGWRRLAHFVGKFKGTETGTGKKVLDALETATLRERNAVDVTELVNASPWILKKFGLKNVDEAGPEEVKGMLEMFYGEMNEFAAEFTASGMYQGGHFRTKIASLESAMQKLEQEFPRLPHVKADVKDLTTRLKHMKTPEGREIEKLVGNVDEKALAAKLRNSQKELKRISDNLAEHTKMSREVDAYRKDMIDHPEVHQALDESYRETLGKSQLDGISDGTPVDNVILGKWEMKVPRGLGGEHTDRFANLVDEARAFQSLAGTPGVPHRGHLLWQDIPMVKRTLDNGGVVWQTEGFLTPAGKVMKGNPQNLSKYLDTHFVKEVNGRKYLRVPYFMKPKKVLDEVATEAWNLGRLGRQATKVVLRDIEQFLSKTSSKGVSLKNMHPKQFGVNKSGRAEVLDMEIQQGSPLHSEVGITDEEKMKAWFSNSHEGLLGQVLETYVLKDEGSIKEYHDLLRAAKRAFGTGKPGEGAKQMKAVEAFLAEKGYKLSSMKYQSALGKGARPATKGTAKRLIARLVDAGMDKKKATDLVRKHKDDLRTLQSELGSTSHVADARMEEIEDTIETIGEQMMDSEMIEGGMGPKLQEDIDTLLNEHEGLTELMKVSESVVRTKKLKLRRSVSPEDLLTQEGLEAYRVARAWKDQLDQSMIDSGLLTEAWVENFEAKFGMKHLRHLKGKPENLIKRFHTALRGIDKKMQHGGLKGRQIEGTINEIRQRFGKRIFEDDVTRIMFLSHVEVGRAVENYNFIAKVADQFGIPATPVKYQIPDPRNPGLFIDDVKFEASKPGWEVIDDHPVFNNKRGGIQLPSEIAKDVRKVIGKLRDDSVTGSIGRHYQKAQNWWKKWALFAWPSYFIRNYVGAMWNNFLHDVPASSYEEGTSILMGAGLSGGAVRKLTGGGIPLVDSSVSLVRKLFRRETWGEVGTLAASPNKKIRGLNQTHQEILDEANAQGIMGKGQFGAHGDVEREAHAAWTKLSRNPLKLLDPRADKNTLIQAGMRISEQMENSIRLGHYIAKRRKGFSAADAADSVRQAHFDYQDLSDFEKTLKKYPFPFWTWTRKNVPLQAQMALQRPGKFTALAKGINEVQRSAGGPGLDQAIVPEWLNENLGTRYRYDAKKNEYEMFLLGSWLPAADLVRIFSPIKLAKNMLSPLIKAPIEQGLNRSMFFNRDLEAEGVPGQQADLLSPKAGQYAAENIPGAKFAAKAGNIGAGLVDDLLQNTLGRVVGKNVEPFGVNPKQPLEEGISVRGRAESVLRQFRGTNEAKRFLETSSRHGLKAGAISSLIGRSHNFNPEKQKQFTMYSLSRDVRALRNEMKKALRRGQTNKAEKLAVEIAEKRQELRRVAQVSVR